MSLSLVTLRTQVLTRLGDLAETLWTAAEVDGYLQDAYSELAQTVPVFWDQIYLENLPRGFSYTHLWEGRDLLGASGRVDYGHANYTYDDERDRFTTPREASGPANHTSLFEVTDGFLDGINASPAIAGLVDVPTTLTALERVTWDERTIEALNARRLAAQDTRYRLTEGEVYGYTWQAEGVRALRKVRVPSGQASTVDVTGSWGLLRDPTDLSGDTVGTQIVPLRFSFTATWEQTLGYAKPDYGIATFTASWASAYAISPTLGPGNHTATFEYTYGFVAALGLDLGRASFGIPRRMPGHQPLGPEAFGAPRRPYLDALNVRVEHTRHGRALDGDTDVCELPARYAVYLQDYAQAQCLNRAGPGQDLRLGSLFAIRWARHLARLQRRVTRVTTARVGVFGSARSITGKKPPRPSLPWQYGSLVRR